MDKALFETLFALSQEFPGVGKFCAWLTSTLSKAFMGVYVAFAGYLIFHRDFKLIIYFLFPAMTFITCHTLKRTIKRPRPFEEYPIKPFLEEKKRGFSMPSNHSAAAVIIAIAIVYYNLSLGLLLLFFSFLAGVSRVFSGVHYPFDVLAGWLIAVVYGALMLTMFF